LDLLWELFGIDDGASVGIQNSLVKCAGVQTVEEDIKQTGWGWGQWPS
jgi:hypothetical protein